MSESLGHVERIFTVAVEIFHHSGGEFATLRSKVFGFVYHTMNVRMETNDIVACHELPARNKETVKHVIVPDQQCSET